MSPDPSSASDEQVRQFVSELPFDNPGGLTFHLPLVLNALRVIDPNGALPDVSDQLRAAFKQGLVDPPLFRECREAFLPTAQALCEEGVDRASIIESLSPLADGMSGAAFHGLIRFSYGLILNDVNEIASGLSYLFVRRQLLTPIDVEPLALFNPLVDPGLAEGFEKLLVFDQFNLLSAVVEPAEAVGDEPAAILQRARSVMLRDPASFVAVHCFTASHAVFEVSLATGVDPSEWLSHPATQRWWRAFRTALNVGDRLILDPGEPPVSVDSSLETLVSLAVDSADTHKIKVASALLRFVETGWLTEDEAAQTLTTVMHCVECARS